MSNHLSEDSIGKLFFYLLQHIKCIQVRLEYAKCLTSDNQKHVIKQAIQKTEAAINHICTLLESSETVLKVKASLDRSDLLYIMTLTEQLFQLNEETLKEITDIIDNHLISKAQENV